MSRSEFLAASAAASAVSAAGMPQQASAASGTLRVRWFGGGVYELSSLDDKQIVLVDAWIWNNTGWKAFGIEKPPELQSAAAYAAHLKARNPQSLLVALTHDHGDHMGDYFELLPALVDAGLPVLTVGQSDLFRIGLAPKFKAANLDMATLVANGGNGMNFGGRTTHGTIHARLVPAIHSTSLGFPAAGFILDLAQTRVYATGDTDLFGDMQNFGSRYKPNVAVLCIGNGAFTMGPEDAAHACKMLGVAHAVPVHYAHNPLVLGTNAGQIFRSHAATISPQTNVTVMKPGDTAIV